MILKLFRILFVFCIFSLVALVAYDYRNFVRNNNQLASEQVTLTIQDILKLNSGLRLHISRLLINDRELFQSLLATPNDSELIEQFDVIFKKSLPSYHTFSLADKNGELLTDHFFEKVGRLCRQDMHTFAVNESATWLTIHPGPDEYHYDLMLPWGEGDNKTIIFLGFKVNTLVSILKNREIKGRKLYIVRSDKNNLVEISSAGSRNTAKTQLFLSDKIQYNISEPIDGTYWAIVDVLETPLYKQYYEDRIIPYFDS